MSLLDDLKEIDIVNFLQSNGYTKVKETSSKVWFLSPIHQENNPSFCVYKGENRWRDFGTQLKKGDIIDLVCAIENCDITTAMEKLKEDSGVVKYEPVEMSSEPLISVSKVLDRYISPDLLLYLHKRGISEQTYNRFTQEAYYSFKENPERVYHAVSMKNDSGGYELRSSQHKYAVSPKDCNTFLVGSASCSMFEGMFDFLSAVEYFGDLLFETDVYVANGLGMTYRIIDQISRYKTVNIFFDLGIGSENTIDLIRSRMYDGVVIDHRTLFDGKKDFNEFWCSINKK